MMIFTSTEMINVINLLREKYIESSKEIVPAYSAGYVNALNDLVEIIKSLDKE